MPTARFDKNGVLQKPTTVILTAELHNALYMEAAKQTLERQTHVSFNKLVSEILEAYIASR